MRTTLTRTNPKTLAKDATITLFDSQDHETADRAHAIAVRHLDPMNAAWESAHATLMFLRGTVSR